MRAKLAITIVALFLLVAAIPVFAQDGPPPAPEIDGEIVVEGLTGPQGLYVDDDGNLWVVDSGFGGEEEAEFINPETFAIEPGTFGESSQIIRLSADGEQEVVAFLPSVTVGSDAIGGARLTVLDGTVYVTVGAWQVMLGEEPSLPLQGAVAAIEGGEAVEVADLWAYELANNPDGTGNIESHPYGIAAGDGVLYVTDAAGNSLLSVDPATGEVATIAVFDSLPGVFPSPFREGALETDPVPTSVVVAEDGFYVSLLSGAPFVPGSAKVLWVSADGEISDYATDLTMLTDLQMGPDGYLYAVRFGLFTQEGPVFNSGEVVRILDDGSHEVVIAGLPFATALAFDADGGAYVAINGAAIPNAGMVVYYEGLTEMEGMDMMDMGMDDMDSDDMSSEGE